MSTLVDAPDRVDGVQLIGEMVGSGYRTPPALVRRGDGQVLQLTPLLYEVLAAVDGRRSCAEIAEVVADRLDRGVTEDQIRSLVDGQLRQVGLVKRADGSEPELRRSNPLLALRWRVAVTNPATTRRLTDPFRVLFRPGVVTAVVLGFVAVVTWVFFDRGLGASAYDAFERPHLLLLVFVVTVLSGGFHEFGHAAAARYGGAQPGVMGTGLYLVWPAFYTDVTDSYRLGRAGRLRTDLGGLYFNAVVVCLTFLWWWATGWEALLLLVATQVLQMVQQLMPLLRFDGYHVLADVAGVPDLYHRIKPTLLGLLPHRWGAPENRALKPWSRALITVWVLVTIPMMVLMLMGVVAAVPRILGSAGAAIRANAAAVARAWHDWNLLDVTANSLQVLAVVLPMLCCALVLGRVGTRFFRGLARWSQDSFGKRLVAAFVSAVVFTGLTWAWWPNPGTYRPIQPNERGLVTSLLPAGQTVPVGLARPAAAPAARAGSVSSAGAAARLELADEEPLVAAFPKDGELPTKDHPDLAVVLVPADSTTAGPVSGPTPTAEPVPTPTSEPSPETSAPGGTWVFPFDQPLPPAEGDNQALAVNTTDDSVVYDVAFALVWADGDEVLNVNEAHAYASCSDCVAVAVAFQVVLIMDDAQVIVPQNLAVAANYSCYRCITAAIANQLVLSVQDEPGQEDLRALGEVWNRLLEFAGTITSYSLTEVAAKLEGFKAEIVAILDEAPPVADTSSATTDGSAAPSGSPSPGAGSGSVLPPDGSTVPGSTGTTGTTGTAGAAGTTGTTSPTDGTTPPPSTTQEASPPPSPTQVEASSPAPSTSSTSSSPSTPSDGSTSASDSPAPSGSASP